MQDERPDQARHVETEQAGDDPPGGAHQPVRDGDDELTELVAEGDPQPLHVETDQQEENEETGDGLEDQEQEIGQHGSVLSQQVAHFAAARVGRFDRPHESRLYLVGVQRIQCCLGGAPLGGDALPEAPETSSWLVAASAAAPTTVSMASSRACSSEKPRPSAASRSDSMK